MFRKFAFVLVAVLLASAPAFAQDKPVQLTIGGGYTSVQGEARDRIGDAGNFTIGVLFHINEMVGVQGEYAWNGTAKKRLSLPVYPSPTLSGGVPTDFFADGNMQYGDFNLIVSPNSTAKTSAYFITGLGIYYRPVNITTPAVGYGTVCDPYWYVCYPAAVPVDRIIGERSSTDFGMNFGGGLNFKLGETTSFYFEVRYHYIWGPTVENGVSGESLKANGKFLPITFGFRF